MANNRAGALDQRVRFLREVMSADDMGGYESTFEEIVTVWANVRPMSGREREYARATDAESDHVFTIRARFDINESDRIEWNGEQFNIRFIRTRPRMPFIEIEAQRTLSQ